MKIHFISLNEEWVKEIKHLFGKNPEKFEFTFGDIRSIPTNGTIFVSPANSLGFMDGGIDDVLRKMLPGIEQRVKQKIASLRIKTILGRFYLPVGSAIFLTHGDSAMISAPTMFLPHDVSSTQNAYHSFLAALILAEKHPEYQTLAVTSHCCNYGRMDPKVSAFQFRQAYFDFSRKKYNVQYLTDDILLMPNIDHLQPNNYDNREIQEN